VGFVSYITYPRQAVIRLRFGDVRSATPRSGRAAEVASNPTV